MAWRLKLSNIVIIGFMGSGKSTIGRALAKERNQMFLDTDVLIEMDEGREISALLQQSGENYLRTKEAWICEQIDSNIQNSVVSTGGGFVINADPRRMGRVIYLECGFESIYQRVISHEHPRPLFKDRDSAYKLYLSRLELYEKYADIKVDTETSIEQALQRVKEAL